MKFRSCSCGIFTNLHQGGWVWLGVSDPDPFFIFICWLFYFEIVPSGLWNNCHRDWHGGVRVWFRFEITVTDQPLVPVWNHCPRNWVQFWMVNDWVQFWNHWEWVQFWNHWDWVQFEWSEWGVSEGLEELESLSEVSRSPLIRLNLKRWL